MGQKQSKEELVHQHLKEGNISAIKALCNEGVQLEWTDKEGKTPLIVACLDPKLYIEAKTLIELGANLDAYRPGWHAGTPLHHAAKSGLDRTVKLLLAHGANPFRRNDDCETPLALARKYANCNVVRVIEDHISYFSGDIREVRVEPGLYNSLVPYRIAIKSIKKCWVAVVPCDPPNNLKHPRLELAVYPSSQDYRPHTVIPLWKCDIFEPKFHESDPSLTIVFDSKTCFKFLSAIEGDLQQLAQLYTACTGVPKVMPSSEHMLSNGISPSQPETNTISRPESSSGSNSQSSSTTNGWGDTDSKLNHNGWGPPSDALPPSKTTFNGWADNPTTKECNGLGANPGPTMPIVSPTVPVTSAPSAPPVPMEDIVDDGLIFYPAIDICLMDLPDTNTEANGNADGSCCVICWEAPIEGACVPCGHMVGCMSCLSDIKSNKGVCPVCRAKIDQVIRIYAV